MIKVSLLIISAGLFLGQNLISSDAGASAGKRFPVSARIDDLDHDRNDVRNPEQVKEIYNKYCAERYSNNKKCLQAIMRRAGFGVSLAEAEHK